MFDCLKPAIDNNRSLSRAECSSLQPKVIICIEKLFKVKVTQKTFIISLFLFQRKKIHARKLLWKIGALCKRKPLHGKLTFEWFLSHEMFSSLLWLKNAIYAHWFSLQCWNNTTSTSLLGEKMVSPCFALRPRVFFWDPVFSTRPCVFHTPCFPADLVFSTPRDPVPRYPGTPAPRFPPSPNVLLTNGLI